MNNEPNQVVTTNTVTGHGEGSIKSYSIGFTLSIILTLIAFYVVWQSTLPSSNLSNGLVVMTILALAIAQLFVQVKFFLHLGKESKQQWNIIIGLFTLMTLAIIVVGSIWIMNNLNYNMMPNEMNEYMLKQVDKGF